jgi:DNA-binding FrmR family transcriptional regulator
MALGHRHAGLLGLGKDGAAGGEAERQEQGHQEAGRHAGRSGSGSRPYTRGGYQIKPMRDDVKEGCLGRLRRIEGQVRGILKMVEEDRYCIDVLTQLQAARAALRRVEDEVLKDHVAHCVEHAIASGDADDQRRKVGELLAVLERSRG